MSAKKVIKKLFAMLVAQIRKELTFQQHDSRPYKEPIFHQETRHERIFKKGMDGFAGLAVIAIVMAWLVFV